MKKKLNNEITSNFGKPSSHPAPVFFKPKLTINQPNDVYEQEADAVADKVLRMPDNESTLQAFFKPASPSLQRKCTHCEEEKEMQCRETKTEATVAPSTETYINSLSGGRALHEKERSFFEVRMGYDLSHVRLHTDSAAGRSAKDINALAFTHENNIVFGSDQHQPETVAGRKLMAHELTHLVQQGGGNKVQRATGANNQPVAISNFSHIGHPIRNTHTKNLVQLLPLQNFTSQGTIVSNQPAHTSASYRQIPQGVISRQDFEQYVINYYGVQTVQTGTKQEQEQSIIRPNMPAPSIPGWQPWDPGTSSEDYAHIIRAIEDVVNSFMSVPVIRRIIFYQTHYEPNQSGVGIANRDVGASFGSGELTIYQAFSRDRAFPVAKSHTQGKYPPVGIALTSPGSSLGAPAAYQGRDRSIRENIVHELGHGVFEGAAAANPNLSQFAIEFNAAVGWVGTNPAVLYDIGQAAVQTAIVSNTLPPAQYRIDPLQWNDPQWIEQPMSYYSVNGGPGEDFAESIAAYVYTPSVMQQRSRERYRFIQNRMSRWVSQMRLMPPIIPPAPVGDFPITEEIKHTA